MAVPVIASIQVLLARFPSLSAFLPTIIMLFSYLQSEVLAEALDKERQCDWAAAAKCYAQILRDNREMTEHPFLSLRLFECYERLAYQSESPEIFQQHMKMAFEVGHILEEGSQGSVAALLGRTLTLGLKSFDTPGVTARIELLDEAVNVIETVVEDTAKHETAESGWQLAANFQLMLLRDRVKLGSGIEGTLKNTLELVEELRISPTIQADIDCLGEVYSHYVHFASFAVDFLDEYRDSTVQRRIVDEALSLVPRVKNQFVAASLLAEAAHALALIENAEPTTVENLFSRAGLAASATKDRYLMGRVAWLGAYLAKWNVTAAKDQNEASKHFDSAVLFFAESKAKLLGLPNPASEWFLALSYAELIESCYLYANFISEYAARRELVERGVAAFEESKSIVERTNSFPLDYVGYAGAQALRSLAAIEEDDDRRRELLSKSIAKVELAISMSLQVQPRFLWNVGLRYIAAGALRYELGQITVLEKRKELLETAVQNIRLGLDTVARDTLFSAPAKNVLTGDNYILLVKVINTMYELTSDPQYLEGQIEPLDSAVKSYTVSSRPERIAEAIWRKASVLDRLGRHGEAVTHFNEAAGKFRDAANFRQLLRSFYLDYALYMDASSHIEAAHQNHDAGRYLEASKEYLDAVRSLKRAGRWSHLSMHYKARAILEEATHYGFRDRPKLARSKFMKARAHFREAARQILTLLHGVSSELEERELELVREYSDILSDFCRLRASMEFARATLSGGDERVVVACDDAARNLSSLAEHFPRIEERREMRAIALMYMAWAKFHTAGLTSNPDLYLEAAQFFDKTEESAVSARLANLARGNAELSRGIHLTTEFIERGNLQTYTQAKANFENASGSFLRFGLERYSNWATGAQRLLDGYMHARAAEREADRADKAEEYKLALDNFRLASEFFMKAEDTDRADHAMQLLDKIRHAEIIYKEQISLFKSPPSIEEAVSITSPVSFEIPKGLEDFEGPNLQARLEYPSQIVAGEKFSVRIDIMNVGRGPASLLRIEALLPTGFEVSRVPESCRAEAETLIFASRRLSASSAESYTVSGIANVTGPFLLSPKLIYMDDRGDYYTRKLEPTVLVVEPEIPFQFGSEHEKKIFDYLSTSFIRDRNFMRLTIEASGWRTLMQIAQGARVSKAVVYGTGSKKYGLAIAALWKNGVIEVRRFVGERGRGGKITKVRLAHDNELVSKYLKVPS